MGVRLNRFQDYFRQTGPLVVTGHIGQELSSSFSMVVNDISQVNDNQLVLLSGTGEMVLLEEEIYRFGAPDNGQNVSILMDGGIELRFSPCSNQGVWPGLPVEKNL